MRLRYVGCDQARPLRWGGGPFFFECVWCQTWPQIYRNISTRVRQNSASMRRGKRQAVSSRPWTIKSRPFPSSSRRPMWHIMPPPPYRTYMYSLVSFTKSFWKCLSSCLIIFVALVSRNGVSILVLFISSVLLLPRYFYFMFILQDLSVEYPYLDSDSEWFVDVRDHAQKQILNRNKTRCESRINWPPSRALT